MEFIVITSNAALERILYKQTWADCRNLLNINSIKAKLQIQINLITFFFLSIAIVLLIYLQLTKCAAVKKIIAFSLWHS